MKIPHRLLHLMFLFPLTALADTEELNTTSSLDNLLNMKITVASGIENQLTVRQSPGVVSVLTRRDIDAIGASNLFELLRYVGGYQFGVDETGQESFLVRGNYGGEGQLLINYNGVPVNENSYGSAVFGGNFSLDHIDRIEIIRGPGSTLYGGTAELGVINIISKKLRGEAEASYATNKINESTGYETASFGVGFGGEAEEDFAVDIFGGYSQRDSTEDGYFGFDGSFIEDASPFFENENEFFQLNASKSGLDFKLLYSKYQKNFPLSFTDLTADDGFSVETETPGSVTYRSVITQLGYRYAHSDNTTINSSLLYGKYDSGKFTGGFVDEYPEWYFDVPTERVSLKVALNHRPSWNENISLDMGYGYDQDRAEYSQQQVDTLLDFEDIDRDVGTDKFDTQYIFLQGLYKLQNYTFTAGLRSEQHSEVDGATVPRLGLTYVNGPFHYKLLASRAFRAPSITSIGISPDIEPELAEVFEIEIGRRIGFDSLIQLNLFSNKLEDVITYDDDLVEFFNEGEVHTLGAELEYRYEPDWGFVALNYSQHWLEKNTVIDFQAFRYDPETDTEIGLDKLLGAAEQKLAIYGQVQLTNKLSLNPSLVYVGERYSIGYLPDEGFGTYTKIDADIIANLHLRYEDLFLDGLDASLGFYNINDGDNIVTTGYFADGIPHADGIGRRVEFKLALKF